MKTLAWTWASGIDARALKQSPPSLVVRRAGVGLDLRSLPAGEGVGDLRKAAFRWIDLLADLGLGLWRVPTLAAHDADKAPLSGLAIDPDLHRGLAEDVEIDDEHITAWLNEEPWRVHHAVHATISESEGEDWRTWPEAYRPEDGHLSVEVDANRVRHHAGLQLQLEIGWKMVLHHANARQVIVVLDVPSTMSPTSVEASVDAKDASRAGGVSGVRMFLFPGTRARPGSEASPGTSSVPAACAAAAASAADALRFSSGVM